jgi:hypothetical protein
MNYEEECLSYVRATVRLHAIWKERLSGIK